MCAELAHYVAQRARITEQGHIVIRHTRTGRQYNTGLFRKLLAQLRQGNGFHAEPHFTGQSGIDHNGLLLIDGNRRPYGLRALSGDLRQGQRDEVVSFACCFDHSRQFRFQHVCAGWRQRQPLSGGFCGVYV